MQYTVTVAHDEADAIWYVQSSDVPGLNAEAPTLDLLIEAINDLTPDLVLAKVEHSDGATIALRVEHLLTAGRAPAA